MIDYHDLPATKKYLNHIVKTCLLQLLHGESVAIQTINKNGVGEMIRYLLDASEEQFPEDFPTMHTQDWLYINANSVEDKQLALRKILPIDRAPVNLEVLTFEDTLSQIGSYLISKRSLNIIIDYAEILIHNNLNLLELIRKAASTSVNICLIINKEIEETLLNKTLTALGIHRWVYLPLRTSDDLKILLEKEERWHNYSLDPKTFDRLIKLSDGHPSLLRSLLSVAKSDKAFLNLKYDDILKEKQISSRLEQILSSLTSLSRTLLTKIAMNNPVEPDSIPQYLVKTGLLQKSKKVFNIKIKLLEVYILQNFISIDLTLDQYGNLTKQSIDLGTLLSNQEHLLLKSLAREDRYHSREEVAEIIWGASWADKYSDWAIDKLISRIRKKIYDTEKTQLVTKKGRGVKLVVSREN